MIKIDYTSQPLKQNWDKEFPKYWFDNSPLKTHYMNAVSIITPVSELAVIHTLKDIKEYIKDPELKAQITTMIAQESWHSFSHKKYNEWLESQGIAANEMAYEHLMKIQKRKKFAEKYIKFCEKYFQKKNLSGWLPGLVSGEHNAAVHIEYFLERPYLLEQMHPHFRQAWVWHFIEELEHKGTAMDAWNDTKEYFNRRKWKLNLIFAFISVQNNYIFFKYMIKMLSADKQLWKWKTLKDGLSFFLGKDGLYIKIAGPLLSVFGKNWHPWNKDTRYLIERYQKILNTDYISLDKDNRIQEEYQFCVADTEAILGENNKIITL
jgi:predicted metal-dependent hydrolase